jgi:hypothetical protein
MVVVPALAPTERAHHGKIAAVVVPRHKGPRAEHMRHRVDGRPRTVRQQAERHQGTDERQHIEQDEMPALQPVKMPALDDPVVAGPLHGRYFQIET